MSGEENQAVIRHFYQLINLGKLDQIDALFTDDYIDHNPQAPAPNLEGLKRLVAMYRSAFADLRFDIEDIIAQGDMVVARATTRGTNQSAFMGWSPTGKQVAVAGIDMFRVKDGKVIEQWLNRDDLGLLQQLGIIPIPE